MQTEPIPTPDQAYVADFSRRFGLIIALLAAVIARRFREPQLGPLTIPLWNRVNRIGRRFQRLLARLAAGSLPARPLRRRPGPAVPIPAAPTPPPFSPPAAAGWSASSVTRPPLPPANWNYLLADPEAVRLLAQAPGAYRILNPLRRLLGIGPFAIRQRPARVVAAPLPVQPPLAFEPLGEIVSRSPGYTWYRCPTPPAKRA